MGVAQEISPPVAHELSIEYDYGVAVQALGDMGWTDLEEAGVPAVGQIEAGINASPLAAWLIKRADHGITTDKLSIAPSVGGEDGIGVKDLIYRLDPTNFRDGLVRDPMWGDKQGNNNPYDDKGTVHDNAGEEGLPTMWDVAVLLGDEFDPATDEPAYDAGLVYTDKTVLQQQEAYYAEKEELAKSGIVIVTATVGHMAVDSVGLRVQRDQPQRAGVTRFIHYEKGTVGGPFPIVGRLKERLVFSESDADDAWDNMGVRRMARVLLPPLENKKRALRAVRQNTKRILRKPIFGARERT